jgi:IMP dehydrogenase
MKEYLTFDDVLIKPKFSSIGSRKEVDLMVQLGPTLMELPVLSANMDTVTGPAMAIAMAKAGGLGVLHRFWTIEDNVNAYKEVRKANRDCAVSVGVGTEEFTRAEALYKAGAKTFILDVAHGAQKQVVEQYKWIKENLIESFVIVGNFATAQSCGDFWAAMNAGGICYYRTKKDELSTYGVDAFKIGIGPGSACTTRIKTGCGVPQLGAVMEVTEFFKNHLHRPMIICDGGMKTPGDIAKALAAGADCVMLGGMLAGTEETPGDIQFGGFVIFDKGVPVSGTENYKKYRGSASKEAYTDQGKDASHRTAEGESFTVSCKGPVARVLQDIEGGLRSAFTYVGAKNVSDFQEKAEFVRVTQAGRSESGAHGNKKEL